MDDLEVGDEVRILGEEGWDATCLNLVGEIGVIDDVGEDHYHVKFPQFIEGWGLDYCLTSFASVERAEPLELLDADTLSGVRDRLLQVLKVAHG